MTNAEIIKVVLAHSEGKAVQARRSGSVCDWFDVRNPVWNFAQDEYRVAPEPRKPREWRLKFKDDLIVGHSEATDVNFSKDWILVREVID